MNEAFQPMITALRDQVGSAAIPETGRHTAAWCVGQLSDLYGQYCNTRESRYAEEITRLLKGVLAELSTDKTGFTEAQADNTIDGFRLLHEKLGLPALGLKPPPKPKPKTRSRKAG